MTPPPNRSPVEWFQSAAHWYVAGHQGCVACGGRHCVFRSAWGERLEYYCSACDFSTCHDQRTGHYHVNAGDGQGILSVLSEMDA